ncbi:hypothetical protein ACF1G0_32255 [Streptomyces sp. NPDC013953]|uniref:hypothetical protein n=1 Tax=Streptomyces sp. NPDC013953 TaxID=3364868 RepID=UPI00370256AD
MLEVEPDTLPGLPSTAATQQVEESVTAAVAALPGVLEASSRFISAVGLPAARR